MSEWDLLRHERPPRTSEAGISAVRLALLFGSAAVALTLIVTPLLDRETRLRVGEVTFTEGLDPMSTGATARPSSSYVIRRSVLQPTPSAICVIHANGARSGDC